MKNCVVLVKIFLFKSHLKKDYKKNCQKLPKNLSPRIVHMPLQSAKPWSPKCYENMYSSPEPLLTYTDIHSTNKTNVG